MKITAAGSLPGDDFRGALAAMAEHFPEVLPWPELPARGIGSGMIGRVIGLIDGLGFDVRPSGWRLTAHPGAEQRRAAAQWRRDLDDAEELLHGFAATLKVAIAGPWTLASSIELPRGDVLLADHGARREVSQALQAAVAQLGQELARRLPAAEVWWQIDEPSLLAVRDGKIPTASGFSKHRGVTEPDLVEALRPLATGAVLHCCAPGRWLDLARRCGFAGASVDSRLVDLDDLAAWCDERRGLVLGVVDTTRPPQGVDDLVRAGVGPLRQIQADAGTDLLLGTACGLAGWNPRDVVGQLEALRRAAALVEEALAHG